MPDGTKLKAAKLRGVVSDGMILAEDEVSLGDDHAGTMVLDDSFAAGTPLADVLPISTDVLELEITPNRPDCLGVYGVAREVHAVTGADLSPPPWTDAAGPDGDTIEGVQIDVDVGRAVPALHGARLRERDHRDVAGLAARPASRGRPAADQQRRRHHELRDAAHRAAAARLRPRSRRRLPSRHPDGERRREDDDARRHRAHARRRRRR